MVLLVILLYTLFENFKENWEAVVVELVDTYGSGSYEREFVGVRVSPTAPDLLTEEVFLHLLL